MERRPRRRRLQCRSFVSFSSFSAAPSEKRNFVRTEASRGKKRGAKQQLTIQEVNGGARGHVTRTTSAEEEEGEQEAAGGGGKVDRGGD